MVKSVFFDIVLRPQRGVNHPVSIHKGELVQREQLLHARLVSRQMLRVAQILLCHQLDGDGDRVDPAPEVVLHDLLSSSGQLVQIQQADRADGLLRIPLRAPAHPDRPGDHQKHQEKASEDDDPGCTLVADFFHCASASSVSCRAAGTVCSRTKRSYSSAGRGREKK